MTSEAPHPNGVAPGGGGIDVRRFWVGEARPHYLQGPLAHEAFEESAARHPERRCLWYDGAWMTYSEVERASHRLACRLAALGVRPGVAVGVMVDRSFDLVIALLAVLRAGGACLPADPGYPDERLAIYLEDGAAAVVLAQAALEDRARALLAPGSAAAVVVVDSGAVEGDADDDAPAAPSPAAPAMPASDSEQFYSDVDSDSRGGGDDDALYSDADLYSDAESLERGEAAGGGPPPAPGLPRAGPEHPAYILFTSGSTGRPKGVVIPHRVLQDCYRHHVDLFALGPDDVVAFTVTVNFDVHSMQVYPTLAAGAAIVVPSPAGHLDPAYIVDLMQEHRVTGFNFTVPVLAREYAAEVRRRDPPVYPHLRAWCVGGEAVPPDLVALMHAAFPGLTPIDLYGPTENIVSNTYPMPPGFDGRVAIGAPDPNQHCYVVHPDTMDPVLEVGLPGELLLSGPRQALGYAGRPDLTAERFLANPFLAEVTDLVPPGTEGYYARAYRTGDLVRWRGDGVLEYLGRIDRQVKVGGVRIELGEVEAAMAAAPGVVLAVAAAAKDPATGGVRLAGYVTPGGVDPEAVRAACAARLIRAAVPGAVVAMDAFPLLPNGKVDVKSLPDPAEWTRVRSRSAAAAAADAAAAAVAEADAAAAVAEANAAAAVAEAAAAAAAAPLDDTRDVVTDAVEAAWLRALHREGGPGAALPLDADFFAEGGSSLSALRANGDVYKALDLAQPPPISLLYEKRTLRGVTAALREALAGQRALAARAPTAGAGAALPPFKPKKEWQGNTRPLSAAQEQMWTVASMLVGPGDAAAYAVAVVYDITGPLSVPTLKTALAAVVDRHEVLRSRYVLAADSSLRGVVAPAGSFHLPLQETTVRGAAALQAALRAEVRVPFDLATGPMLRAALLRRWDAPDAATLVITLHHAVSDGWSQDVLAQELGACYAAAAAGANPAATLPRLPAQYADFAKWHGRCVAAARHADIEYWRQALAGAPEMVDLPTDRPRPAAPTAAGAIVEGPRLSPELMARLRAAAAAAAASPFSLFLAAFQVVLARLALQEDVVVGVPVSQRRIAELQPLIGCFVNEVAVRARVDPATPFSALVGSVNAAMAGAQAHSTLPFADLVKALDLGGGAASSINPVFQSMFEFIDDRDPGLALGDPSLSATWVGVRPGDVGASQMDFTLEVAAPEGRLIAEYSTELFDAGTVTTALECYAALLEAAAAAPDAPVAALDMLSPDQRADLDMYGRGAERDDFLHGPLAHEEFRAAATAAPDARALFFQGVELNYADAVVAVDAVSLALEGAGCCVGTRVGVMIGRCLEQITAIMGSLQAGCVYVPLDPGLPHSRLLGYIEDAAPEAVLVAAGGDGAAAATALLDALPPGAPAPRIIEVSATGIDSNALPRYNPPKLDEMASAVVFFTSGSTGRPKGVEVHHAGLRDLVGSSYGDIIGAGSTDVFSQINSIGFDPHLGMTLGALCHGAALAIAPQGAETDPPAVAALCLDAGITILDGVPSLVTYWVPELAKVADRLSVRVVLLGGEALPPSLVQSIQTSIPHLEAGVYNAYGPTEFTNNAVTTVLPPSPSVVPIGVPDPNARAYVVDPAHPERLQPPGAPGELLLSGIRLAKGYVGRPDLTAERFLPNPFLPPGATDPERLMFGKVYRTGDLVRWDADGALLYLGRTDRQVKLDGVRIELGEVEDAMVAAPGVTAACAVAVPGPGGRGKRLVGVVAPAGADPAAVIAACKGRLMAAAVPSTVLAVDALPLSASGKTDAREVEAIVAAAAAAEAGAGGGSAGNWYVPPGTDLESTIQRVWGEVLGMEEDELSVELDFFRAGGSSLRAGILTAALRNKLTMPRLPATLVYQAGTVRAMAAAVERIQAEEDAAGAAAAEPAAKPGLWPRADDPRLELLASQTVLRTRMPYWAYLIVQYIMLSIIMVLVPVMWGALLVALFELRPVVGVWALVGLWPALQVGALFGYIALVVALKWALVQRLRPGVYPLHGWMYARWVTLRALQDQAGAIFLPALRRTPLMPLLLRALGAKVESFSDTLIDSISIYDFDLLTIKKGASIYEGVSVTGAFIAPAGYLGASPVLVLSPVVIGRGCHLGHNSVVTAGSTIPDFHNLKPHASPAHPGDAPVAGPLADFPHFVPEERMSLPVSMIGGIFTHFMHSVIEIPSLALSLYIIWLILGEVPLVGGGEEDDPARLVAFAALFTALFGWLEHPLSMALHAAFLLVWKWATLGRLTPGRDLTASKGTLLAYAIMRRWVESPLWEDMQELLTGTPLMGHLYRALGARVGRQVFIGGLTCVEFDALTVGDYACSGSFSRVYATDDDGIVTAVVLKPEATIGNSSVVFPAAVVGERAVVGNDTAICMNRDVPPDTRVQGSIQYSVGRGRGGDGSGKGDADEELGLPQVVRDSAAGAAEVTLPWWHVPVVVTVLLAVAPAAHFFLWIPLAVTATVLKATYLWLLPVGYVVAVGMGACLAVAWLRLMVEVSGIKRLWAAGSASVFDLRALVIHSYFKISSARLDVFAGTPFAVWIYRALGFAVADGAVLMGDAPLETSLVRVGPSSVVEAGGLLDGHYLEFLRFIYLDVTLGEGCWVQERARVMPSTEMKDGARVLPASMVLPGDTLEERMVWCGLPAEPIAHRPVPGGGRTGRRLLRSSKITRRSTISMAESRTGMSGFLGGMASKKQVAASKKF